MTLSTGFRRRAIAIATCVLTVRIAPAIVQAQPQTASQSYRVLELGVHYGAPERFSGSVSGVFARRRATRPPPAALVIRGGIGPGGVTLGIGHRWLSWGPFGPEAVMTVTRAFSSPRQVNGRRTYVGVDVGLQYMERVTIGIAHRVDGPSAQRDTVVRWSVGVQVPYGFWRW